MYGHVIHTTLIAFCDLISKTDTTVNKCDFTVNNFASILLGCHPSHCSLVAKLQAQHPWDLQVGGLTPAEVHNFPGFDEITFNLNILVQYFMVKSFH